MKLVFLAFVFILISISAKAETVNGRVKLFFGRSGSVETGRLYTYYALLTQDGERLLLPEWIDGKLISAIGNHQLMLDGDLQQLPCHDVSDACPTGEIKTVHWLQYQQETTTIREEIFTGLLKRFSGRMVESNAAYDYIALAAGEQRVQMPSFLVLSKLEPLAPQVTLFGTISLISCTDMSEGCGPAKLSSLRMMKLDF